MMTTASLMVRAWERFMLEGENVGRGGVGRTHPSNDTSVIIPSHRVNDELARVDTRSYHGG